VNKRFAGSRELFIRYKGVVMKFEYAFLFAVILLPICLAAQTTVPATGTIRGTVTDRKTGEPLIGASVVIVGIDKVASTDIYGTYSIDSIPNGTYTLMASYIGYKQKTKKAVKVRSGKTTRARFALKEEKYQFEMIIPCERKYCANVVNDDAEFQVELFRESMTIQDIFGEWKRIAMYSDQFMLRYYDDHRHHIYRRDDDPRYKLSKIDIVLIYCWYIQVSSATFDRDCIIKLLNTSFGVFHDSVSRGRSFNAC